MTAAVAEAPAGMEWRACEICGSDGREYVVSRTDLFLGGDTPYHMYRCRDCGVVYQHPRPSPEAIGQFYPSDYQQFTPDVARESWLRRLDRRYGLRKRCQIVTRHVAAGRLLDVGCATGDFLGEMKLQPGWSVLGIEPVRSAARYARDSVGVPVVASIPNTAPFADNAFDAVTLWDVLEHVHDPRQVLGELARVLRPGGVLVVNHPNWNSIDRRLFGRFWLGFELPRHLHVFPDEVLRRLMAEYGFEWLEDRCLYGSTAASSTSVGMWIEQRWGQGRLSQLARSLLYSKPLRLLLLPAFKVIDERRLGSNITVVFRKIA